MPTYTYECYLCGYQNDYICKIDDRPKELCCCSGDYYSGKPYCLGKMRQIITVPSIQCDDIVNVPWIREFANSRPEARFKKKTIETRGEYKKYLKDKDLRPSDGINLSEV